MAEISPLILVCIVNVRGA